MGFNLHADWVHATSPIPRVTLRLEQLKEARVQARDAMIKCHGSAGTSLGTHANREDSGLEESRAAILT
jgi:hypothetical protein